MTSALPLSDGELRELFADLERTPLALCVSGGADSMALMHMVARWAALPDRPLAAVNYAPVRGAVDPACGAIAKVDWRGLESPPWLDGLPDRSGDGLAPMIVPPQTVILTVDHGLRQGSSVDANFVASEARKLGFPCQILRWEGEKPASGIQEAARRARRDLLCDAVRAEAGFLAELLAAGRVRNGVAAPRTLVMAHHLEDQAETVLMRLARGSGLDGLSGMRIVDSVVREPTRERPSHFRVRLARPLLDVPKARLMATLRAIGAGWIEDPSNEDERFERVRIRKALVALGDLGLSAEKIALSARRLRDAETGLQRLVAMGDDPARPSRRMTPIFAEIDLVGVDFVSRYTAARCLGYILRRYGGASRPADLSQIEYLANLTLSPLGRATFAGHTLGGCKIELSGKSGRTMRIYREGSGEGLAVAALSPGRTIAWDGDRFTISARDDAPDGLEVRALGMRGWAALKQAVPEFVRLKWPAAAAATLPVVARGRDIVAHAGVASALRAMGEADKAAAAAAAALEAVDRHAGGRDCAVSIQFGSAGSVDVAAWSVADGR
ncbi:MAG: tRNA lysidine(34) synthetase TilS [Hyphomicrobiaceae bacterium]|nr:tRNA lysidine(34) synthetase TilS [Hyphomicrobiaceae bacterium]